jgi:hypothetical protein
MIYEFSKMPPLSHYPDREKPFKWKDSELCKWIMSRPSLWEWCFEKARGLGVIEFNGDTGMWSGVDFGESYDDELEARLENRKHSNHKHDPDDGILQNPVAPNMLAAARRAAASSGLEDSHSDPLLGSDEISDSASDEAIGGEERHES